MRCNIGRMDSELVQKTIVDRKKLMGWTSRKKQYME